MNTIKSYNTDEKTLLEALKGEYGTYDTSNGIRITKAGRIVQWWGTFPETASVVEIPVLPERYPVTFSGDDFSCVAIAEANSRTITVPTFVQGKRFVIFGSCLLNS